MADKKARKLFTFTDAVIVLTVFLFGFAPMLFLSGGKSKTVVVELDGKQYASFDLESLGTRKKELVINSKYGKNILSIDRYGADMIYSDCPRQTDVKHRKITSPGEAIVCAPHKLVVYISGESELDAISE